MERIELAKLILVGTRTTYQATGDAGCTNNIYIYMEGGVGGTSSSPTAHGKLGRGGNGDGGSGGGGSRDSSTRGTAGWMPGKSFAQANRHARLHHRVAREGTVINTPAATAAAAAVTMITRSD